MSEPKVLFVGAGAIGASVAAWIALEGVDVTVLDVGEIAAAMRDSGVTVYEIGNPERTRRTVKVRVAERLGYGRDVDIVVLAVKNYSLEDVARKTREELGDRPIVVSMANGRDNQEILPKFFSRAIYCVVGYNARRDKPVVVGYQKKGPLLIGTPGNNLGAELRLVQEIFPGLSNGDRRPPADVVHTKIVMNLTNALDALVGQGFQPLSSFPVYQHLLSQTLWEGVRVVQAAGYREHRISGMPSFALLHLSALLPGWATRPLFRRKLGAMVMASMTQDVALKGPINTEID